MNEEGDAGGTCCFGSGMWRSFKGVAASTQAAWNPVPEQGGLVRSERDSASCGDWPSGGCIYFHMES